MTGPILVVADFNGKNPNLDERQFQLSVYIMY